MKKHRSLAGTHALRRAAMVLIGTLAPSCVSYFRPTPDVLRGAQVTPLQARHYAWAATSTGSMANSVSTALFGSAMAFAVGARVESEGNAESSLIPAIYLGVAALDVALGFGLQISAAEAKEVAQAWEALALAAEATPIAPR